MNTIVQPLVSIIIPCYNQRHDFLKLCIESVIKQTYSNIEIVVSNNHSTNGIEEVLDKYRDVRLRIVKPPVHLALASHFQWASEQSTGEYISFLPSDDWLEEKCIDELVGLIHNRPNIVMAFCNVTQYFNGRRARFSFLKSEISSSEDEIETYVRMSKLKGCLVGCILRKSVYSQIGGIGHGGMTFASDRWLFIQMTVHGDVAYSEKPYAVYRNENPLRNYRMFIYSEDVLKLFRLIEQKYLHRIRDGKKLVQKERKKMAVSFLKSMPTSYKQGYIREEEFSKTLANIKELSQSKYVQYLSKLYEKKRLLSLFAMLFYLSGKLDNAILKVKNKITRITLFAN